MYRATHDNILVKRDKLMVVIGFFLYSCFDIETISYTLQLQVIEMVKNN